MVTVFIILSGLIPAILFIAAIARWIYQKGRKDAQRDAEIEEIKRMLGRKNRLCLGSVLPRAAPHDNGIPQSSQYPGNPA